MIEPVSWTTDEDLGKSVEVHREGAVRVPIDKFEAGQLMQWPDINSDGVMIRGIMLESVFFCGTPLLCLKCLPLFLPGGGGVVAAAAPLAVVEAVTSRVSVL